MNKYERNAYNDRHFRRHDPWRDVPFEDEPSILMQCLYGLTEHLVELLIGSVLLLLLLL